MRNAKTINTTTTHTLPGGTEENNLYAYNRFDDDGNKIIASVWVPDDEEREAIAQGANIRLNVWGRRTPPVLVDLTDEMIAP